MFLDEPTTGVDPASRRFMWSCIQECQKQNKNIVLTSHSMDECEFLCNRLAIMNSGQLNCIGPILELKKCFGLGFLIIVLLKPKQPAEKVASVKAAIQESFDCVLREEYGVSRIVNLSSRCSVSLIRYNPMSRINCAIWPVKNMYCGRTFSSGCIQSNSNSMR